MDHYLQLLPPMDYMAIGMRAPKMPDELVRTLKCALATMEITKQEATKYNQAHARHLHSLSWAKMEPQRCSPMTSSPSLIPERGHAHCT